MNRKTDYALINQMYAGAYVWLEGTEFPTSARNVQICMDFLTSHAQASLEAFHDVIEATLREEQP